MNWVCRDRVLACSPRPLVMGIVNITPDSFSDGGQFATTERAVAHALQLVADGADILDLGGESTRPGSTPVSLDEERMRVLPVVRELVQLTSVPLSIDTMKAVVAREALAAGASIINDVSAGTFDPAMLEVVAEYQAGFVLMHMQGTPTTMHLNPTYGDVVAEVCVYLAERVAACERAGIPRERIVLDPGIGFGKNQQHSLALLTHLDALAALGLPVLLGVSRKGFIGIVTGRERADRMAGTLAVNVYAAARSTAHILRVHDVAPTVDAARMLAALAAMEPTR